MDIPESLLDLERAAEAARQAWARATDDERDARRADCLAAAEAVALAITKHATETGTNRYEVVRAVKRRALHPDLDE